MKIEDGQGSDEILLLFDVDVALHYIRNDPEFEVYRAHTREFRPALTTIAYIEILVAISRRVKDSYRLNSHRAYIRDAFKILPLRIEEEPGGDDPYLCAPFFNEALGIILT